MQRPHTVYHTATTLDGFIADPSDSLAWLFALGGEGGPDFDAFLAEVGALAMGANTFRWLVAQHKLPTGEQAPWPYQVPAWVFTHQPQGLDISAFPGADIRPATGTVGQHIAAMRQAAGAKAVWVVGGGDLAGQFADEGLLDEVRVTVASATLGAGKPLLPRRLGGDAPVKMRLVGVCQYGERFVDLHYRLTRD